MGVNSTTDSLHFSFSILFMKLKLRAVLYQASQFQVSNLSSWFSSMYLEVYNLLFRSANFIGHSNFVAHSS